MTSTLTDHPEGGKPSGMKRILRSMARSFGAEDEQREVASQQRVCAEYGGTPCGDLSGRQRVTLVGRLCSVTTQPMGTSPSMTAELTDGSGTVKVVWLGRREIAGIHVGRVLRVHGLAAVHDNHAVMYNPRYELLPNCED